MAVQRPINIDTPWADAGLKATIPGSSQIGISDGRASWPDGFPPLTMTQIAAGGVPFFGQDMNGILNALSAHTAFQNSGGQYRFDPVLVANIGGYPVGTVLQDDNGIHSYRNVLANNSVNFNTTPAAIGVSWMPYSASQAATETLSGIAELATQTEVNTGTDNLRIVTPAKLKSGSTYLASDRGYIKLPSWMGSLILQWGIENTGEVATTGTINFPVAFTSNVFVLLATEWATGPQVFNVYTGVPTNTNFVWYGTNTTTGAADFLRQWNWIAIGV